MNPLKSFTISVGTTDVFNLDVLAPDRDTALILAERSWHDVGVSAWTPCPAEKPRFQVEDERNILPDGTRTYRVSFEVMDRMEADVQATTKEEAICIGEAMRLNEGTYDGAFDITHSDMTDMDAEEVRA